MDEKVTKDLQELNENLTKKISDDLEAQKNEINEKFLKELQDTDKALK